jgi:hypothetical protein
MSYCAECARLQQQNQAVREELAEMKVLLMAAARQSPGRILKISDRALHSLQAGRNYITVGRGNCETLIILTDR